MPLHPIDAVRQFSGDAESLILEENAGGTTAARATSPGVSLEPLPTSESSCRKGCRVIGWPVRPQQSPPTRLILEAKALVLEAVSMR